MNHSSRSKKNMRKRTRNKPALSFLKNQARLICGKESSVNTLSTRKVNPFFAMIKSINLMKEELMTFIFSVIRRGCWPESMNKNEKCLVSSSLTAYKSWLPCHLDKGPLLRPYEAQYTFWLSFFITLLFSIFSAQSSILNPNLTKSIEYIRYRY